MVGGRVVGGRVVGGRVVGGRFPANQLVGTSRNNYVIIVENRPQRNELISLHGRNSCVRGVKTTHAF